MLGRSSFRRLTPTFIIQVVFFFCSTPTIDIEPVKRGSRSERTGCPDIWLVNDLLKPTPAFFAQADGRENYRCSKPSSGWTLYSFSF